MSKRESSQPSQPSQPSLPGSSFGQIEQGIPIVYCHSLSSITSITTPPRTAIQMLQPLTAREPLSTVHNIVAPSRSIRRCKDSSENTPSTIASDDEAYVFPAAVVSLTSLGRRRTTSPPESPAPGRSAAQVQWELRRAAGARSLAASPQADQRRSFPAYLAPLQPLYSPPERTPTPAGLPSYEGSQRAAEARLSRRVMDGRRNRPRTFAGVFGLHLGIGRQFSARVHSKRDSIEPGVKDRLAKFDMKLVTTLDVCGSAGRLARISGRTAAWRLLLRVA